MDMKVPSAGNSSALGKKLVVLFRKMPCLLALILDESFL